MKKMTILIPFLIMRNLFAQGVTPEDWGLEAFHINNGRLGEINYYVTAKGIDEEKPLLFLYSGCRGLPTMLVVQIEESALQIGTVPPDQIYAFSDNYHVAFIGRPGTPFCDTMQVEEINPLQNLEDYQPSVEYIEKCGMEWEIQASSVVIDTLCRTLRISGDKIVAIGYSEGGIIVTRLAAENNRVTHLVNVISTGLNQFYSSIINRRMDAAMGIMTHQEAQAAVDSLFAVYERIYSDPDNTDKWYEGHPYKRWGSFCDYIPLEDLVKLDIPILFVNGSNDRSSPILQADYVKLEFIRLGKTNLTYHVLPGSDHWFSETIVENGEEQHLSHRGEAFQTITDWISSH